MCSALRLRATGARGMCIPPCRTASCRCCSANTGIGVSYAPHYVDLDNPALGQYPFVIMTGHYAFEFTDAEVQNLRQYLRRGGMLFASAAAGLKPFDLAFRREIKRVCRAPS